jgi:hypothetical protein
MVALLLPGACSSLHAHELEVGCKVLPQRRVAVEAWFDTKQPARNARVKVTRANNDVVASSRLDDKGRWLFSFRVPEQLMIVVSDGAGHRAETELLPRDLLASYQESFACAVVSGLTPEFVLVGIARLADHLEPASNAGAPQTPEKTFVPETSSTPSGVDRPAKSTLREVITGLAFLLALAAFLMSLRNARRLRALEDRTQKRPESDASQGTDREG